MVIFNDQIEKTEPSLLKKIIKRTLWTIVILMGLFLVSVTALSSLSGQREALKLGLQDFLSASTNMDVKINQLNYISIYPETIVDIGDIQFRKTPKGSAQAEIASFKLKMRFWDVIVPKEQVREAEIEGIKLQAGFITKQALKIDRIYIQEASEDTKPKLRANGALGNNAFDFSTELRERITGTGSPIYNIDDDSKFNFSSDFLKISGQFGNKENNYALDVNSLSTPPHEQSINLQIEQLNSEKIEATVISGTTNISADIDIKKNIHTGTISSQKLTLSDIAPVLKVISDISALLPDTNDTAAVGLPKDLNMNLNVVAKNIMLKDASIGNVKADLTLKDGDLAVTSIKGALAKGALKGSASLKTSRQPFLFNTDIMLSKWHHSEIQRAIMKDEVADGTASTKIELTSESSSLEDIVKNLQGKTSTVAGKGKFKGGLVNLWGGGLLNAMLPKFSKDEELNLNCMIANFEVTDGIAKTSPLFIDTQRVTIQGQGEINLISQTLDMKIKPDSKSAALLSISSAVNIKGPLSEPKISANKLDLGKNIGSALLGVVNPAFLAVTLTDFGLGDDHPCNEFFGNSEKNKASDKQKKKEDTKTGEASEKPRTTND